MYAKVVNNEVSKYPYTFKNLKAENPNVSFPSNFLENESASSEFGVVSGASVLHDNKPGWIYTETTPVLDGGSWKQAWSSSPKDKNDLSFSEITPTAEPVEDGKIAVEGDPELVGDEWRQTWNMVAKNWLDNRADAYGSAFEQIEFITEHSLKEWKDKVTEIKAKYPKS